MKGGLRGGSCLVHEGVQTSWHCKEGGARDTCRGSNCSNGRAVNRASGSARFNRCNIGTIGNDSRSSRSIKHVASDKSRIRASSIGIQMPETAITGTPPGKGPLSGRAPLGRGGARPRAANRTTGERVPRSRHRAAGAALGGQRLPRAACVSAQQSPHVEEPLRVSHDLFPSEPASQPRSQEPSSKANNRNL